MIRIERHFIERVRAAAAPTDLHDLLQRAIQLEHSTIPPYLTAMFSLAEGKNRRIAELIRSIVVEEMLHMCIASNILIAIGAVRRSTGRTSSRSIQARCRCRSAARTSPSASAPSRRTWWRRSS